jgi:hypothetical protein
MVEQQPEPMDYCLLQWKNGNWLMMNGKMNDIAAVIVGTVTSRTRTVSTIVAEAARGNESKSL